MDAHGIPLGLDPTALAPLLARRAANLGHLTEGFGGFAFVHLAGEPAARVYLEGPRLLFPSTVLNANPDDFVQELNALMLEAALYRSAAETPQRRVAKTVPATAGRQFYMTPKLLAQFDSPPRCSICLDPLIPEGMNRKKVWQIHGPQCTFHCACLRRWHRESTNCPNCNLDCCRDVE